VKHTNRAILHVLVLETPTKAEDEDENDDEDEPGQGRRPERRAPYCSVRPWPRLI